MKKIMLILLMTAWSSVAALKAEEAPKPLVRAHAHNDYYHKRPLLDALAHGFCSVEADVFLKNGKLLVGHFSFELKESRSLEVLYLAPLAKRVKANGGSVHKTKAPFHLMIDFKTDGPKTYSALQPLLEKYRFMLTEFESDKTKTKAVTIVISGSRPRAVMEKQIKRLAGYDGRLSDLGQAASPHFMPWISDSWRSHFKWRGKGELSTAEQVKLKRIAQQAHNGGQKVRFWAAPDNPAAWESLHKAGVDFINTDRLDELAKFLQAKGSD
ncbi:MAG: phosphatidylinositol-specific phospholipase C/glycerophosphodiester phosphodiesterase family protein [Verrucomicrobiota bacterium]|jgi:hypothetical protein|nr:phosphatidylinositol-specific phospholipase C/glycerophosphodiester phosphodiesterase family protein [Verrucomicrobiota bacterium]MDP7049349.1 phosphatidylinositol-specific phospholipase C/glycerophosphodiester phosphodiesterase family protein [Verrucomicrobiota bacterium]